MRLLLAAALAGLALAAHAQSVRRHEFEFIGWNKACSAAISLVGYGQTGDGSAGEPVAARVGTLTIAPGEQTAAAKWVADLSGWDRSAAERARAALTSEGYTQPGYSETVRPERIAPGRPDLAQLLVSTEAFRTRAPSGWPEGRGWRLSQAEYSPLGSCAVLVFAKPGVAGSLLAPLLVRTDNPGVRLDRARAHVTNARLLFDNGDAAGALEETELAAKMAPESALARYHHAALLCLNGYIDEALAELTAAIHLDVKYAAKAREDKDLDSLFEDPRFKGLTRH